MLDKIETMEPWRVGAGTGCAPLLWSGAEALQATLSRVGRALEAKRGEGRQWGQVKMGGTVCVSQLHPCLLL